MGNLFTLFIINKVMMFLKPDSVNVECYQLSQVNQTYGDDYIFNIKNVMGESVVWFIGVNTSTSKERYDRYEIELVDAGSVDPSQARISLNRGQYTYEIYKYNGGSIDEMGAEGDVLETGKVVVDIESKNNYTTNIYE